MRGSSPRMTMWGCASFYSSFRGAASAKSGISDYEGSLLIILVVIFVFQQTSPFSGLLGGFPPPMRTSDFRSLKSRRTS